jgi:phospholipase C
MGRAKPARARKSKSASKAGRKARPRVRPKPKPRSRPHPKPPGKGSPGTTASPIEHVVIVVKENHTFDNYFGAFPGAAGAALGRAVDPEIPDPPHDHEAWLHRDDPAPRGAVRLQYGKIDIPAYWAFAQQYTLCDNYFTEIASQSEPNHLVLITGGTPLIDNAAPSRTYQPQPPFDVPSLPALLLAAGREWRAYTDDPAASYFTHIKPLAGSPWNVNGRQFDQDAAAGTLPAVSWLYAPGLLSEHPGPSRGQPNVGPGSQWTAARVAVVANGPLWAKTAIFITWDDWGGHYDHVPPPNVLQWMKGGAAGYQGSQFRYGNRVPCLVVSPYANVGVNSDFHSHVSIVKFCLRNFGLPSLGAFDALPNDRSDDMWSCFNFASAPRLAAPSPLPK